MDTEEEEEVSVELDYKSEPIISNSYLGFSANTADLQWRYIL